jgi:hypothetical protein
MYAHGYVCMFVDVWMYVHAFRPLHLCYISAGVASCAMDTAVAALKCSGGLSHHSNRLCVQMEKNSNES